jgi:phospholipase C
MPAALHLAGFALCAALLLQSRAAAAGDIRDVQSVVIFMQENRAFDHYYGTLGGVRGSASAHCKCL